MKEKDARYDWIQNRLIHLRSNLISDQELKEYLDLSRELTQYGRPSLLSSSEFESLSQILEIPEEKNYSEKLKDPRWQKKRLKIFERDDWSCQNCGDRTTCLQVHHLKYFKNRDPWDYPSELLKTLCERCHEAIS